VTVGKQKKKKKKTPAKPLYTYGAQVIELFANCSRAGLPGEFGGAGPGFPKLVQLRRAIGLDDGNSQGSLPPGSGGILYVFIKFRDAVHEIALRRECLEEGGARLEATGDPGRVGRGN